MVKDEKHQFAVGDLVSSIGFLVAGHALHDDRGELGEALRIVEGGHGNLEDVRLVVEHGDAGAADGLAGVAASGDGEVGRTVADAVEHRVEVGRTGAPVAVDRGTDLDGAALTGDVGLDRERERTELVHILVVVLRFKAGIADIGGGGRLALELGLSTLFVGLESLVSRTTARVGGSIIVLHIVRGVARVGKLHRINCHCETEVCSQQSCGDHKQR